MSTHLSTDRRHWAGLLAAGLAILLLGACTPVALTELVAKPGELPQRAEVAEVPFVAQTDYYCGPASLAMVYGWLGRESSLEALVAEVYTPGREGTLRTDLITSVRRNGFLGVPVPDLPGLFAEVAAGHPVLVLQNLGLTRYPQWHYAVVTGYDLQARAVRLHSGTRANLNMRLDAFIHTWMRGGSWGMVVLSAGQLPAAGTEREVALTAAGLERAGHNDAAARVYRAMLDRWPNSLGAHIGLANAASRADKPAASARHLRRAIRAHPRSAAAWHNLAMVLAALDDPVAASVAARRAIALSLTSEREAYYRRLEHLLAPDAADASGASESGGAAAWGASADGCMAAARHVRRMGPGGEPCR